MKHLHWFIDIFTIKIGEVSSLFTVRADKYVILPTVDFSVIGLDSQGTKNDIWCGLPILPSNNQL